MEIRIVSGKKYVFGRVCMFLNCTARSSVAKATCQVATRHLGAATESTYVPCPANLFAPATASPRVFVLLSDRFSSDFPGCSFDVEWLSSLLQSCHFHSFVHSNCVVFTLFRVLRVQDTHFDCSCWSKNDRLSWVQTCDCLTKSFLKLYKTRTECTVSGNNLDRRSCSLALAPFCPCRETFREAPVDTSDLRIVLKLPFKYDPACSK